MTSTERKIIINMKPSLKSVILDVFFMTLYIHHIPNIINNGSMFGSGKLIDISSVPSFIQSYFGKIFFLIIVFTIFHYIVVPNIRKTCL
jgi:hypothetical protein